MIDTKLKPLYREVTFWIMLAMSLPGIVSIYDAAISAIGSGAFDQASFSTAILASPVVAYLLARQYPRGKAVEAAGVQAVAFVPDVPQAHEVVTEPADAFGAASEYPVPEPQRAAVEALEAAEGEG